MNEKKQIAAANAILAWYKKHGRDLPWRSTSDPYHIWVLEVLMQQTQVSRGTEYYYRFVKKFPDIHALAKASWRNVLPVWRGLGYYRRGQNMLRTAKILVSEYDGAFPETREELLKLPGIGPYTASALQSFAFKKPVPAIDTNMQRVLGRFSGKSKDQISDIAFQLFKMKPRSSARLNHALMDIGATVCQSRKVDCQSCPLRSAGCAFEKSGKSLVRNAFERKARTTCEQEYVVACLYEDRNYYLPKRKLRLPSIFPVYRCKSKAELRRVLKEALLEDYRLEIAVRPPFVSIDGTIGGKKARLHYCRCRVLGGSLRHSELKIEAIDQLKSCVSARHDLQAVKKLQRMSGRGEAGGLPRRST